MGSRKAVPTTGTSRRSAITRCFCSTITATAWRRSCDPGNVSSADDWEELLVPEIDRQQAEGQRVAFRADAAFARPAIYEALETRGVGYAIRIPANKNLELAIEDILFRSPGRPSRKPLIRYKSFHYQADSWTTRPTGRGESRAPRRRAVPARRLHRDESPAPQSRRRAVLQQARHRRAMDQGRQASGALDAAVVSSVPGERGPAAAERARVQPRAISGGGWCCHGASIAGR